LIAGGQGVVGASLVRALLDAGHEVLTLDPRDDLSLVHDIADQFERRQGSVLDVGQNAELLRDERIDTIAHGAVFDAQGADPFASLSVNAYGVLSMLEAARRAEVPRLVFMSSKAALGQFIGEYGSPTYAPLPPEHPRGPMVGLEVYSMAKRFAEESGELYADRFGLEFVALRFATIVGPGKQVRHGPTSVHSRMIENAIAGAGTDVAHGGEGFDDMVYVKDVAQAIVCACTCESPPRRAYNIGSGRLVSLTEFAEAVRRHVADVEITIGPGVDYIPVPSSSCLMDISAARAELGYEPAYDVDSAVIDYVATVRGLGLASEVNSAQSGWKG
jgi:UDP-glucose 4-epimerase